VTDARYLILLSWIQISCWYIVLIADAATDPQNALLPGSSASAVRYRSYVLIDLVLTRGTRADSDRHSVGMPQTGKFSRWRSDLSDNRLLCLALSAIWLPTHHIDLLRSYRECSNVGLLSLVVSLIEFLSAVLCTLLFCPLGETYVLGSIILKNIAQIRRMRFFCIAVR